MAQKYNINVQHGACFNDSMPEFHENSSFIFGIPDGWGRAKNTKHAFKGICLVISAYVGYIFYKANTCEIEEYQEIWKKINKIKNRKKFSKKAVTLACKFLWERIQDLSKHIPGILDCNNQTKEFVLPKLADFFDVQFTLRESENPNSDVIVFQTHDPPTENKAIINLHRELVDTENLIYHVSPITFLNQYKKKRGLACYFCKVRFNSNGYKHICRKNIKGIKNCLQCRRIIASEKVDRNKKTYLTYCLSNIEPDENVEDCQKCRQSFKSEECKKFHAQSTCPYGVKCTECGSFLRLNSKKSNHAVRWLEHNCLLFYCPVCKNELPKNHLCKLVTKIVQSVWCKIAFISLAKIDSSFFKCFACLKLRNDLCAIHKDFLKYSNFHEFNYAITYREKNEPGVFFPQTWSHNTTFLPEIQNSDVLTFSYTPPNLKKQFSSQLPAGRFGKRPRIRTPLSFYKEKENDPLFIKLIKAIIRDESFINTVFICISDEYLGHVLEAILALKLTPLPLKYKNHCLSIVGIYEKNVSFMSFHTYIKCNLHQLTSSYLNTHSKTCFPITLNHPIFYQYNGGIPHSDFFIQTTDSNDEKRAKANYVKQFEGIFSFHPQLHSYISNKCFFFAKAVLTFLKSTFDLQETLKEYCHNSAPYIHPFMYPINSISSYTYTLLRLHCLYNKDIYVVKHAERGYPTYNTSPFEREIGEFLEFCYPNNIIEGTYTQHEGQKRFPNRYILDYYDATDHVGIMVDGCKYHYHYVYENCTYHNNFKNAMTHEDWNIAIERRKEKEILRAQKQKEVAEKWPGSILEHVEILECQWNQMKIKSKEPEYFFPIFPIDDAKTTQLKLMNQFFAIFDGFETMSRLIPRESVKGGYNACLELFWTKKDFPNERLFFYDYCSFYASICINNEFPTQKYEILMQRQAKKSIQLIDGCYHLEKNGTWKRILGIALVSILPPKKLKRPLLSFKMPLNSTSHNFSKNKKHPNYNEMENSKIIFALCRTCAEKNITSECNHTDKQRRIITTVTFTELAYCVTYLNYTDVKFLECWCYLNSSKIFSTFTNVMVREKMRCSGNTTNFSDQEFDDKINEYMHYKDTSLEIKPEELCKNDVISKTSKLMLNSGLGCLAYNPKVESSILCRTEEDVLNGLEKHNILDAIPIGNEYVSLIYKKNPPFSIQATSNLILYAHILSYSRIKLFQLMESLEKQGATIIMADTDSVCGRVEENKKLILDEGPAVGQLKEQIPGNAIELFILGPKAYHITFLDSKSDEKIICKLRGISLSNQLNPTLNTREIFYDFLHSYCEEIGKKVRFTQLRTYNTSDFKKENRFCSIELTNNLKSNKIITNDERISCYPYGYCFKEQ